MILRIDILDKIVCSKTNIEILSELVSCINILGLKDRMFEDKLISLLGEKIDKTHD